MHVLNIITLISSVFVPQNKSYSKRGGMISTIMTHLSTSALLTAMWVTTKDNNKG